MGEIPVLVEIVNILTVEVVVRVSDAGSAHHVPTDFGEGIRVNVVEARITGSWLWGCHGIIIAPPQGHSRDIPRKMLCVLSAYPAYTYIGCADPAQRRNPNAHKGLHRPAVYLIFKKRPVQISSIQLEYRNDISIILGCIIQAKEIEVALLCFWGKVMVEYF